MFVNIKVMMLCLRVIQSPLLHVVMVGATILVRVEKSLHEQMKLHDEINWSEVIRQSLSQKLEKLEQMDHERAQKAVLGMDELRKENSFSEGGSSGELIREWREKRK